MDAMSSRSLAANINATLFLLFSVSHRGQSAQLEPERGHLGHQNGRAAVCTSPFAPNVAAGLCGCKEPHLNTSLQELLNKTRVTVTNAFLSLNNLRSHSLEEYMSQTVREMQHDFLVSCVTV